MHAYVVYLGVPEVWGAGGGGRRARGRGAAQRLACVAARRGDARRSLLTCIQLHTVRPPHRPFDCPQFDVLETSGDVQLRRYAAERYVVTHIDSGESLLAAQIEGTKV